MELTTNETFLEWVKGFGIGIPAGQNYPPVLGFVPARGDSRFWETPSDSRELLALVTLCLDNLDSWHSCWLYKREGAWTYGGEAGASGSDHGLDVITRWVGIPDGFSGSVRFDQADRASLVLGLMIYAQHARNTSYDLFLVPDHGQQFLWLDHGGALFVFFADSSRVGPFVSRMEAFGFALPTTPPSGFTWQPWMEPQRPARGEAATKPEPPAV